MNQVYEIKLVNPFGGLEVEIIEGTKNKDKFIENIKMFEGSKILSVTPLKVLKP